MSIAPFVPARLLLDAEEESLFLEWQGSRVRADYRGQIRNAEEYCRFIQECEEETASFEASPHAASQCGHTLHPSVHILPHYCPVCEVRMSLIFLDAIAGAFEHGGGPWLTISRTDSDMPVVRECWHLARFQLQELVESLEISADHETEWDLSHPNDTAATRTNNSKKALGLFTFEHKYPAVISETRGTGTKRKVANPDNVPRRKKTVTLAPNTNFGPARSLAAYSRFSKQYSPGEHACNNEDGWLKTSQCDFIEPDFRNLKLFSTQSLAKFSLLEGDSSYRPGEYQGLLGANPAFDTILTLVATGNGLTVDELTTVVRQVDAIIVLFDGDKVLDFHLSSSADIEEIEESVAIDQNRSTSPRDIVSTSTLKTSGDAAASDETSEFVPQRKQRKIDHD